MTNVSNIDSVICLKLAETNNQSLCQFERKAFLFCYFFCFIWVVWICCCSSIIAPHLKPAKFIADDNKITITHENLSNPILFRFPIKKSIACMINHDSFGCFFTPFCYHALNNYRTIKIVLCLSPIEISLTFTSTNFCVAA